jgi:hypothetical protein
VKKFEQRFEGTDNRGLRAEIRRVVKHNEPSARYQAILNIAHRVALTASGRHTLKLVALDYTPGDT